MEPQTNRNCHQLNENRPTDWHWHALVACACILAEERFFIWFVAAEEKRSGGANLVFGALEIFGRKKIGRVCLWVLQVFRFFRFLGSWKLHFQQQHRKRFPQTPSAANQSLGKRVNKLLAQFMQWPLLYCAHFRRLLLSRFRFRFELPAASVALVRSLGESGKVRARAQRNFEIERETSPAK